VNILNYTLKKRIVIFIESFVGLFIIGFLTDYFLKDKNINYYTITSVALGLTIPLTFFDKISNNKLN